MGCKESFDGTVVYNLQQKMTAGARKNFERFKLRRKEMENMQQDPNFTHNRQNLTCSSHMSLVCLVTLLKHTTWKYSNEHQQTINEQGKNLHVSDFAFK